ncbi:androgen-dependent TFPI-regulating protein [Acomys russatus]|uniref:androgen-dependent TFPI-regulating protein n=1 Tax=Acomys russatus TaxID=60746 RepID=UPI0021E26D41|nr:androgen-dependent TFPI-regulating protein [Acomys russatus]XP_051026411.1 androgen-dependent TFPI-regulating protein [Acomys russatus]XP_051026419.1 androgen-dependent TFPI-regulating protein [Acomys russatus]
MTKTATCTYHFLLMNWYIFLYYYIPNIGKGEEKLKEFHDGTRWKYLTILNLLLQAVFFGVASLDDVLKRISGRKDIKFITSFRDLLFATLAFPISTFVSLVFWTLFIYDRSLVYPQGLDDYFPAWTNHAMHTFIFPLSLAELILRPHRPPSKKLGLTLLVTCILAYISSILWRYAKTGNWVYPVFAALSPLGITVFLSANSLLVVGIYLLGEKINQWRWGATVKPWVKKK